MLKEAVASKAAKLLMTCVCPVAGTTALTLSVPEAREAVNKAVQPRQYAKPKTRVRAAPEAVQLAQASTPCPTLTPLAMTDVPFSVPGMSVPSTVAQLAGATEFSGASQLAEVPQPASGAPLTSRIFISRPEDIVSSNQDDDPERASWLKLMLGFSVIGIGAVPRVSYRRNGDASGDDEPA